METENNITGVEFLSDLNVLLSTSVGLNRNVKLALKKLGEHERADQVYRKNGPVPGSLFYRSQGRNAVSIMTASWNRI